MSIAHKLLPVIALLGISVSSSAQQRFTGDWQGVLNAGRELHVVFHIKDSTGATMDVVEQGVKDLPASGININGDSIRINISRINGSYMGVLTGADHIQGKWEQAGRSMPMDIKRNETIFSLTRPQTPVAPFSYTSEDLIFHNTDKSVQYGATLTLPKGSGQHPAVLLISGSGAQNRDEETFGHKPFAVIADHLTRNGYAVLRVDDRGTGKTTGESPDLTSADFIKDAGSAIDYLRTRKEINTDKIGLAGHSEGGMIAEMLGTQRKDIDFIVLLAGPGIKTTQLMMEQNGALLRKKGMSEPVIAEYLNLYNSITQGAIAAKTKTEVHDNVSIAIKKWRKSTDPQIVLETTGITDITSEEIVSGKIAQQFESPWLRYFLSYDPAPYLQKLDAKVLALNGDKDMQVISATNLKGIESGLAKSKTKQYTVKEIPGLNHLFQQCKQCTIEEYGTLEETFSPIALQMITEWLDKNVK